MRAIKGNTAILPETLSQTKTLNTFNFEEIDRMLDQASGGAYAGAVQKYFANMDRQLSGNVDLRENLAGTAAANLYRGVGGSQFGSLSGIKNAQSYIDQQKQIGSTSLERWSAVAGQLYQPVNAASMFDRNRWSPEQQVSHDIEERNVKFQRDWVNEQIESQYRMSTIAGQAIVKTDDQLTGMISGMMGSAAGGAAGGGGGM